MSLRDWAKRAAANTQVDSSAARRAREASKKADRASASVEKNWSGGGADLGSSERARDELGRFA